MLSHEAKNKLNVDDYLKINLFLSLKKKQNKRDCQAENEAELISLKSDMRDYHMYVLKVTLTHHFLQALVT